MDQFERLSNPFKPPTMQRIQQLAVQLTGNFSNQNPDDVVITYAKRSPLTKANRGGMKDARADELMLEMFKAVLSESGLPDPALIGDICIGTVLTPGAPSQARAAALAAGIPDSVPIQAIHRYCSSGLMAVTNIANSIRSGEIEVGLALGVESMSENPDNAKQSQSELISHVPAARDCTQPMGWTAENVAADFNISRHDQDDYAALSFQRAEAADKAGHFAREIVPFTVFSKDPKTGDRKLVTITKDDGIRYGTTAATLSKIRPAFDWGNRTTTGGNASQITDGAAACLLMTRRKANELGLKILAKHVATAVAGVPPRIMGVGPVYAIPKALKACGISQNEVDLFEINEAFASQCLYSIRELGIPLDKVNVNGGAIAFGHPLDKSHSLAWNH
ncbi:hypothetical protein MIND_00468800 [Mycena indigotica]|uniref:3-ketoacyl-CoA thiolase n=1 Tax=Mycena indigotica TaxID=2126181 RepID=A0A8H6SWL5_9AGAR|nr:uncharacterized protein MIND_00468800 [Mycena indigotica]KAF7306771.1 hypothetical protein MIND_00468800 [Mycena indigotica]